MLAAVACSGPPGHGAAAGDGANGDGGGPPAASSDAGAGRTPWHVTGFPTAPEPLDNAATDAKVELGRILFYDPVVSVDRQVACATCHSEVWGMGDGLAVSVGHGAGLLSGPGRNGDEVGRRNSPTLWNVAFRDTLFHDGRASSLEDQVHFPFAATNELARPFADVVAEIRGIPAYVDLFRGAFPAEAEPVSEGTFSKAVAAFERTLIARGGLYEAYLEGDDLAMSASMSRGMQLFAEVGCTTCHVPPLFSSERFANRGVGAGTDEGRFEVTGEDADRGAFKVPTLWNLPDTGPYFHDGSALTPDEAVRHEAERSATHDGQRQLDDEELADLTDFVTKSLFDTITSPTRPRKVPSGLPVPIDGFSLLR